LRVATAAVAGHTEIGSTHITEVYGIAIISIDRFDSRDTTYPVFEIKIGVTDLTCDHFHGCHPPGVAHVAVGIVKPNLTYRMKPVDVWHGVHSGP